MRYAITAIVINAVISISLFPTIGFLSVPTGTVIAAWTEVALLSTTLRRRHILRLYHLLRRLLGIVGASTLLALSLHHLLESRELLEAMVWGQSWIVLFTIAILAVPAYGLVSIALGVITSADIRRTLRG
ncbi:MAG: hypothetical protein AAGI89_14280, partial [Pseudomonadota bacterium]